LPSNAINDVAINSSTGEVFIATDKGLVFKELLCANEDLSSLCVSNQFVQNTWTVSTRLLIDRANVKINGQLKFSVWSYSWRRNARMGYLCFWKIQSSFWRLYDFLFRQTE
jgi:hypothetical protein